MSDIFVSYASVDRERAKIVAEALAARGLSVWWDRVIPPGRQFDEVIEEALDAARCVVVLWSQASTASTWVKTEAAEAPGAHQPAGTYGLRGLGGLRGPRRQHDAGAAHACLEAPRARAAGRVAQVSTELPAPRRVLLGRLA